MVTLLSEEEFDSKKDSKLELSSEKSLSLFFCQAFSVTDGFGATDAIFAATDDFDDDLVAYLDLDLGCVHVFF